MAKKGLLVLIKDDYMKCVYAHRNAELKGLGKKIAKLCRELGLEGLRKEYDNLQMVDEETPMTPEQIQAYKNYMPEQLWKEDLDWSTALMYTKDITKPLKDGFGYAVDYAGFIPSWRCRFRYCLDLDNGIFQVAKAGLEMLSAPEDEFLEDGDYLDKIEPCVLGRFPIDNVPEDWMEQCQARWNSLMLVALEWDAEAATANEAESDPEAQHHFSKMRFYLGRR